MGIGRILGWGALALMIFGCESPDDPCVPERCDVRERACQNAVARAVQCLRGGDSVMPEVSVITAGELDAMYEADEVSDEERVAFERVMRGYALFELADPDATLEDVRADATAEVAALYDPESKRIMVVDRGEPMDDEDAVGTLAHEMVHAMQDADHDLTRLQREAKHFDGYLARKALIEGEAVHYQVVIYAALAGIDADRIDWSAFYASFQGEERVAAIADASPIAMATVRFPYAFGVEYATRVLNDHGRAGLAQRFEAAPPESTREIILMESANTLDELQAEGIPVLPSGELIEHERLGAFLTYVAGARSGLMDTTALSPLRSVATASGADIASFFYVAQTDAVIGAWRQRKSHWRSTTQQSDAAAWSTALGPALTWHEGADLMLIASDAALDPSLTRDAIAWQMVPPDEDDDDTMTAAMRVAHALRWSGCKHVPLPR